MKFKTRIKMFEDFEATKVDQSVSTNATVKKETTEVTVDAKPSNSDTARSEIIQDVDNIIDNLAKLSDRMEEEIMIEVDSIIEEALLQPIYENKFFEEMMKTFKSMKSFAKLTVAWPKIYKSQLKQELANLEAETQFGAQKNEKIDQLLKKVEAKFDAKKAKVKDLDIPGEKKREQRAQIDAAFSEQKDAIKAKISKKLDAQLEQVKAKGAKKLQDIQAKLSDFENSNKIEAELVNKRWTTNKGDIKADLDQKHIMDKTEVQLKYDDSDNPDYAKKLKERAAKEAAEENKKAQEKNAEREAEFKELEAESAKRAEAGSEKEKEANAKLKALYSTSNVLINALKGADAEDPSDDQVEAIKKAKKDYNAAKGAISANTFIDGGVAKEETEAQGILDDITGSIESALDEYSDKMALADSKKTKSEEAIEAAETAVDDAKNELDLVKDNGSEEDIKAAQEKLWTAQIAEQKARKAQAEAGGEDVSKFDAKIKELEDNIKGGSGESKDDESKEPTQEELDAADKGVSDAKASYDEVKDGDDEKAKLQAEIKVKQAQQKRAKLKGDDELYQGLGDDIGELMKKIQALGESLDIKEKPAFKSASITDKFRVLM